MPTQDPHYQWYAIYTQANAEKKLFNNLTSKNIECYLPTRKVQKSWIDRNKWTEEPLFRCYLFVKVSYKEFFIALNTPGVVCYISFAGKAQAVPESQINTIKTLLSQTDHEITVSHEQIQKGHSAEVLHGSLKGVKGDVINLFGQTRLLIPIDSLNCSVSVKVSNEEISLIEENHEIHESFLNKQHVLRSANNRNYQSSLV